MTRIWDMHVHPHHADAVTGYGPPFSHLAQSLQHAKSTHFDGDAGRPIPLEQTMRHLEEAEAEGGIVVNVDSVRWSSQVSNASLASLVRPFAPKLRFFASVDPNRGQAAVQELERSIREDAAIGLKLHPSYQDFFPNDRKLAYPLYEVCQAAGIPVLLHSGTCWLHRVPIEQSRPIHLDQVALDFPELRLILAHGGWPWADELIAIVWRHEHVYMDLSGNLPRFLPSVIWHYANIGAVGRKMLFGSDYPFISPRQWVEGFSALTEWFYPQENRVEHWREGAKERILGQNFIDMMGGLLR